MSNIKTIDKEEQQRDKNRKIFRTPEETNCDTCKYVPKDVLLYDYYHLYNNKCIEKTYICSLCKEKITIFIRYID